MLRESLMLRWVLSRTAQEGAMTQSSCGCPELVPSDWEGTEHDFSDRTFYVEDVRYFFGAPLGVEKKMAEAADDLERKGYVVEEPLMVLAEPGRFSGKIWIAILPPEGTDPKVRSLPPGKLLSTYYQRRSEPIEPGVKAFRSKLAAQGKRPKTVYLWHASCPQCVASEGFKTVIFAAV